MEAIHERVALVRSLSERLQAFLASLSQEDWQKPSACEHWEVRDVIGHLIGGAERQIESLRRGLAGDSAPPAGFVPLDADAISANNARQYVALRESLGNRILPTFTQRYRELGEFLNGLGPQDWDQLCWHLRRGTMTASEYVDLRIQELTIHDWDVRSAYDPDAGLDPDCVGPLLDIAPMWLGMTFRPGPKTAAPVVYGFDLSGLPERNHQVVVDGNSFQIRPNSEHTPDVVVRCSGDSYLLYMYGRITASSPRLTVEGDSSLMAQFETWFKGL